MVDLLGPVVLEFDDFGMPALGLDGLNDGQRILPVAVWAFVGSPHRLENADRLPFLDLLSRDVWTHLTNQDIIKNRRLRCFSLSPLRVKVQDKRILG
jgi:hypothetical protein